MQGAALGPLLHTDFIACHWLPQVGDNVFNHTKKWLQVRGAMRLACTALTDAPMPLDPADVGGAVPACAAAPCLPVLLRMAGATLCGATQHPLPADLALRTPLQGNHKSPIEYIQAAEPIKVHGLVVASYGCEQGWGQGSGVGLLIGSVRLPMQLCTKTMSGSCAAWQQQWAVARWHPTLARGWGAAVVRADRASCGHAALCLPADDDPALGCPVEYINLKVRLPDLMQQVAPMRTNCLCKCGWREPCAAGQLLLLVPCMCAAATDASLLCACVAQGTTRENPAVCKYTGNKCVQRQLCLEGRRAACLLSLDGCNFVLTAQPLPSDAMRCCGAPVHMVASPCHPALQVLQRRLGGWRRTLRRPTAWPLTQQHCFLLTPLLLLGGTRGLMPAIPPPSVTLSPWWQTNVTGEQVTMWVHVLSCRFGRLYRALRGASLTRSSTCCASIHANCSTTDALPATLTGCLVQRRIHLRRLVCLPAVGPGRASRLPSKSARLNPSASASISTPLLSACACGAGRSVKEVGW